MYCTCLPEYASRPHTLAHISVGTGQARLRIRNARSTVLSSPTGWFVRFQTVGKGHGAWYHDAGKRDSELRVRSSAAVCKTLTRKHSDGMQEGFLVSDALVRRGCGAGPSSVSDVVVGAWGRNASHLAVCPQRVRPSRALRARIFLLNAPRHVRACELPTYECAIGRRSAPGVC